jgi:hypothetical protein
VKSRVDTGIVTVGLSHERPYLEITENGKLGAARPKETRFRFEKILPHLEAAKKTSGTRATHRELPDT